MNDFSEKMADIHEWHNFLNNEEIENILEYRHKCIERNDDEMILRFLFEKITYDNVMFPFYVWTIFKIEEDEIVSLAVHVPVKIASWLETPDIVEGKSFLPIESIAFSADRLLTDRLEF